MANSVYAKWPLHNAVFEGDHDTVRYLLRFNKIDLSATDPHGNTALHIAVALGCEFCIKSLLQHNAPVGQKNKAGWHALHEAVSYGHRPTVTRLLVKLKEQARSKTELERPITLKIVGQLPDFQITVNWEFNSWVPFVKRILPYDVCKLYKKGSRLRVESTLIDFHDSHWQHGDITFIFNKDDSFGFGAATRNAPSTDQNKDEAVESNGACEEPEPELEAEPQSEPEPSTEVTSVAADQVVEDGDSEKLAGKSSKQLPEPSQANNDFFDSFLVILDNRRKQYQRLRKRETAKEIDDEVSALMSSDIVNAHLRFDDSRISRERRTAGLFGSTSYRRTTVNDFEANCYEIHGLVIEARKRREHLSDVEIRRNKEILTRVHERGEVSKVKYILRNKGSLIPPMRTVFDFASYIEPALNEGSQTGTIESINESSVGSRPIIRSSSFCRGSDSGSNGGSLHDVLPEAPASKATAGNNTESLMSRTRSTRHRDHDRDHEYTSTPGVLGRHRKEKVHRKHVHARVAMSTDFPLSVPEFVLVLDVIAPYKKFNRLREFLLHRLPPGFPVKLEVPVYPTVNAKVVFSDFAFASEKEIPDSLFEIPPDYTENPRLFPGV